jgi:hypothetical protein
MLIVPINYVIAQDKNNITGKEYFDACIKKMRSKKGFEAEVLYLVGGNVVRKGNVYIFYRSQKDEHPLVKIVNNKKTLLCVDGHDYMLLPAGKVYDVKKIFEKQRLIARRPYLLNTIKNATYLLDIKVANGERITIITEILPQDYVHEALKEMANIDGAKIAKNKEFLRKYIAIKYKYYFKNNSMDFTVEMVNENDDVFEAWKVIKIKKKEYDKAFFILPPRTKVINVDSYKKNLNL